MTKTFDEVISGVRTAKKGVEVREDLAQMGEYCKQFTDEAGQKANAARDEAKGYAANAKASEKKATDAVAGIEQTKTDAVQAVQNAQTTATDAVQQAQSTATSAVTTKQTEAVQAVGTAQTGAVKAVDDERDAALQQVESSTATAKGYAESAASAANAAGNAATAAGGYASNAKSSATAASGSASAAATSESNAASSAQSANTDADRAEAAAELAGTRANTDKTLKTENAPADAKATGEALDKKANKDAIIDSEGNVIFYSKAAVDKLLKGKLDIKPASADGLGSGLEVDGAGKLGTSFYNRGHVTDANEANNPGWYSIPANATNAPLADAGQILSFSSTGYVWPCQIFLSSSTSGIHFRTFDGANWGAWMAAGIVASGSNYVRFGDGTQICWGHIVFGQLNANSPTYGKINFALPFANTDYAVVSLQTGDVGGTNFIAINLVDKTTTYANESLYNSKDYANNAGVIHDCIVIGRWK